ncbi:uncharacterized protein [Spinacia oleracea]|uniref:Uncharacterized protein isoform X2 n=1 Tax=Spinacia oleracea TaxID=3562 RepID=A0ABM3QMM0_SPIOL|nr:uncharacterized protein LOC130460887 isoform X2 [Spinacia oleracea]
MHYHSFLFSVMCKCSYLNDEELKNQRNRIALPSSASSSRVTTPTNRVSSPSSSASQREVSTTFFSSSPRTTPEAEARVDTSPKISLLSTRQSEALEAAKLTGWIEKDDARSGGNNTNTNNNTNTPRLFLSKLKPRKLKRRINIGSTLSTSSGSGDVEEPDWPPFADEDYIVFCFEEDGAFHVIEDSPTTISPKLRCEEHGNLACACSGKNKDVNHLSLINRRDCLLPNKEAEEEMSPKLNHSRTDVSDHLLANNKFVHEIDLTESMDCRNGSVESTESSQLDYEEHFQNEHNPEEVEHSSSPWNNVNVNALLAFRRDCLLSNTEIDEDDVFLSPKAKLGVMISIDELLKGDNDISSIESDQSSGFSGSDSRGDQDDQLEGNEEELASESAKSSISNQSNISSTSFEFPVLEWAWMGSPVTWPRSGRIHFRKHKSRPPACLRCCKF